MSRFLPAWSPSAATILMTLLACAGIHAYRVAALASQGLALQDAQREIQAADDATRQSRAARLDGRPAAERLGLGGRPRQGVLVQGWRSYGPEDPERLGEWSVGPNPMIMGLAWMEPRTLAASYHLVGRDRIGEAWVANNATAIPASGYDRVSVIPAAQEAQAIVLMAERWRSTLAESHARSSWLHRQTALRFQCDAAAAIEHRRNAFIAMLAVLGVGACAAWALWQETKAAKPDASGW